MNGSDSKTKYGSDLMADMLRQLDMKYAFMLPGSTYRELHDSIVGHLGNTNPEIILCNHEGIAVDMAHGYAKVTGKPGLALLHNVVGLLNGTNAIYNVLLDQAPVVIVGGFGPLDIKKRRMNKERDWDHAAMIQGNVVRDYVKWDVQPGGMAEVPDAFIKAYQIAATDPQGAVYVCLDAGLQKEVLTDDVPLPPMKRYPNPLPPQADAETISRVAKLLVEAKHPIVIADFLGRNPKAVASLVEMADLLALPVIDAGRRFNFPSNHPLDLTGAENDLLKEADVVLALDVQYLFPYLSTWETSYEAGDDATKRDTSIVPDECQVIHINLQHLAVKSWSQFYGKLAPTDIAISADTALALPMLTAACRELLTENRRSELKQRFNNLKAKHEVLRKQWQTTAENTKGRSPISIPWLVKQTWEVIKNEDWALVGPNMSGWPRRLWDWDKPHQYVGYEGLGCGMGQAMGAALAHRPKGRLCINFQADGDFLFAPSSLWTAAHHQIPMLVIMNNNRTYYNSERHEEMTAKGRERPVDNNGIGTRIDNPSVDYATLARSFGLHGVGPIEKPCDLLPALEEAIKVVKDKKQLALVDVVTEKSRER
ncbi:thiamine pyrophosphate-binding protein [Chloroflexota bacterium]